MFIEKYLSDVLFFCASTDSAAIELRENPVKKEKKDNSKDAKTRRKRGRPKKDEVVPPKEPTILQQQEKM